MMTRKPLGRPLGDTEYLLEQWGWWRMDGMGIPTYVSPMMAVMRDAMPVAAKSYSITDDWATAIDSALAKLIARDQQIGEVIWFYFGAKWTMVRVGKRYGLSEAKARELKQAGVAWIDCAVREVRDAA
ncbi:antiterminator Q family protein [Pseudomonas petrae]|uniref:Antitermination protein Q n=1 Tax=Pseudomonas petrae TaxID=2912190 RepID=A0ABS9IDF6_9PSED|nr:antiterminator Q family protein [Pseudomonas petrae]MCF7537575.1 antitermination protein Q [Pseudomonas petrae]MCF7545760.1 antitermination protein Q [Pseudomonas petrae]MCF7557764.1 antitermination protein Q [Pseudomonas petrae]